jgi:Protein of unknown function (DUF3012)
MNRSFNGWVLIAMVAGAVSACAPEVGSDRWCEMMRDTPRGDWSANDALDYARNCVFEDDE